MPANLTPQPDAAGVSDDRFAQAGRVLAHLQSQLAELDLREQQVNAWLSVLAEQQRAAQLTQRQAEASAQQTQTELNRRAVQLAEAEEAVRERMQLLNRQEEEFARRAELQAQERAALRDEQTQLRTELLAEAEAHQCALESERRDWHDSQRQRIQEFQQQQAEAQQLLEQARAAWLQEQEQLRAELLGDRQNLDQERQEQERLHRQWTEQRQAEERRHQARMEEQSREKLASLDEREREIQRREIDLQKRFRLHEDHLDRARQELTAQRSQADFQKQQYRAWVVEMEASLQLRLAQMRNFRDLLAQRERCLAEERRAFEAQRRDSEAQCQQERAALLAEREHAEAFRADELRLRDARRQRLSVELDQIERRREEIDALHARLAILLADLQRSLPAHEETPGEAPASHLVQLLQLIARQLAELEESRRQLTAHQQARREEDLALSAWVEAREAWIRERETAFERQLEDLTEREQHWRGEREQWRSERMQVEQLIRDLVLQLESAPSEASGNVGARSVSEETRHPDDAGTFSIASDAA